MTNTVFDARAGAHLGLGAAATALFYPFGYAKVLIQIGYEPLAPVAAKTIFGRDRLIFPNIFKYLSHIRSVDGISGLYRGLVPRLIARFVESTLSIKVLELYTRYIFPEYENESGDSDHSHSKPERKTDEIIVEIKATSKEIGRECLVRCVGIIVAQPFHVLMLRSMAQFVGGEEKYSTIFGGLAEIYNHDGILGYFAGLVPRLMGEAIVVILGSSLAHIINTLYVEDKDMKGYTKAACQLLMTQLTYPFVVVSNVSAVSRCGLLACSPPHMPLYTGWRDCWQHLRKIGQLKRGGSLFWRFYNGPTSFRGGVLSSDTHPTDDFVHFRLHSS